MAGGWLRDGAVQDQIDANVEEAVERARKDLRSGMGSGKSARACAECGDPIAEARRKALPGVRLCIKCQSELEDNAAI